MFIIANVNKYSAGQLVEPNQPIILYWEDVDVEYNLDKFLNSNFKLYLRVLILTWMNASQIERID